LPVRQTVVNVTPRKRPISELTGLIHPAEGDEQAAGFTRLG
jgi:hypothetical protein